MHKTGIVVLAGLMAASASSLADSLSVTIRSISADGVGPALGTIVAEDTAAGLRLTPYLHGLPPGEHGFHLHTVPSCAPGERDGQRVAGLAAGGHYDPAHTDRHAGPAGDGHLGDLPALEVDSDGTAREPVVAPRLSVSQLLGHSLVIHAGGDNYSDSPQPLGGGGARMACGEIE